MGHIFSASITFFTLISTKATDSPSCVKNTGISFKLFPAFAQFSGRSCAESSVAYIATHGRGGHTTAEM